MACSSYRKGNILARNFDWYYTNLAEFIVRTPHTEDKYATIGVGGNSPTLTDSFVKAGIYDEHYKYLPYTIVDGINETGLAMSANVVPVDNVNITSHTNLGKPGMSIMRLMRYVLDYHHSALKACEDLQNNFDIYAPHNERYDEEFHFLIADSSSTYVIEFIKQEGDIEGKTTLVYTEVGDRSFITNFRINNVVFGNDKKPDWSTIESAGQGVERFEIIVDNYDSLSDVNDFKGLAKKLQYTHLTGYTDDEQVVHNPWLTEFTGIPEYPQLTVETAKSNPELFNNIIEKAKVVYANRTREDGSTWHSEHVSIYDMENLELHLFNQEDFDKELVISFEDWQLPKK